MDPGHLIASAIAASEGTIVAVGSDDEVREACHASTMVLSGRGRAITPRLTDGHQRLFSVPNGGEAWTSTASPTWTGCEPCWRESVSELG